MAITESQRIAAEFGNMEDRLCVHLASVLVNEMESCGLTVSSEDHHRLYERLRESISFNVDVRSL